MKTSTGVDLLNLLNTLREEGWVPCQDHDIPLAFSFASQAWQYPASGPGGIGDFKGELEGGKYVNALLFRDRTGVILGILNHYPQDVWPYELKGNVNIFIDPACKRKGIGTALLIEASRRWEINLKQQKYTAEGRLFATALIKGSRK